ncbi:Programmed cell death protein 2 [Macleaya cordata]|uniref:Programmed cell death protein 2 n=1 Tax=Macleaya cordata TaxID=56857 RepID=A0A200Q0W7_MACCD|nr:Programmed cell death protein 2 [Macleaya cordata]
MGEVILGMPGPWAENYHESADHYTTKIGGLPDWPIEEEVDIRSDLLECRACGSSLCLVMQVYAPISRDSLKIDERIIYVFGCVKPKCANDPFSWRAVRVQKSFTEEESRPAVQEVAPSTSSSGLDSNSNWLDVVDDDLNNEDVDLEELGRALSEAASQASHSKKQNGHQQSESTAKGSPVRKIRELGDANRPVIPCFYIYSQEESSSGAVGTNLALLSLMDNRNDPDDHKEEEAWEEEGYEYDRALYVDRTYLKFKKRMDAHPEQCFRYSYGGKPLLATREIEEPGKCGLCSGTRHYEMQLMPPLLFFLREASDDSSTQSPEDWNWMTLIVYTCSKSCSPPLDSSNGWTVAEEAVIVQFEKSLQGSTPVGYLS